MLYTVQASATRPRADPSTPGLDFGMFHTHVHSKNVGSCMYIDITHITIDLCMHCVLLIVRGFC